MNPQGLHFLDKLHRLLALPKLTAMHVSLAVKYAENVAQYLTAYHRGTVHDAPPSSALMELGVRYLALEALFCAIQVLGAPLHAERWWPRLIHLIPTRYESQDAVSRAHGANVSFAQIAERVSKALELLKRGIRPAAEDTIELKRELLCGGNTTAFFKKKRWEPWREDDAKSRKGAG